jgi:hypothetical protein
MRVPCAVQRIITQVMLKSYAEVVQLVGFVQGCQLSVIETGLFGNFVHFELQAIGHGNEQRLA